MAIAGGKHALITGGGSGVGAEVALTLAAAGAMVTICGRQRIALDAVAAKHANINAVTGDVTYEQSVTDMFAAARRGHGPIDIVVANAGAVESAPFARTSLDLWQRMLAVNLTGVFLTMQQGFKDMAARDWGRIIAVASTAGLKGYAYVSAYCAAKHGVVGLTRALAAETAGSGTTVNAVCPGYTETPMLDASVAGIVKKTGKSADEVRGTLKNINPMGRFVQPDEISSAVLWLVGPGSEAVTGQAISISGGETW